MNRDYLLAVVERAIKTAAQSALLVIGADQLNALHAAWVDVAGFALGGFVLSVLTSLATSGLGGNGPSATTEVIPGRHRGDERGGIDLGTALVLVVLVILILILLGYVGR